MKLGARGDLAKARQENEALRKALAWYADRINYEDGGAPGTPSSTYGAWTCDFGKHARKVLRELGWELGRVGELLRIAPEGEKGTTP